MSTKVTGLPQGWKSWTRKTSGYSLVENLKPSLRILLLLILALIIVSVVVVSPQFLIVTDKIRCRDCSAGAGDGKAHAAGP